jgi:hypothetical protein
MPIIKVWLASIVKIQDSTINIVVEIPETTKQLEGIYPIFWSLLRQ